MDAQEKLARLLAAKDVTVWGLKAWDDLLPHTQEAYLSEAAAMHAGMQRDGWAFVHRALLLQALAALERQPRGGPNDWWPGDAAARSEAKRALRQALGNEDPAEIRARVEARLDELPDVDPDSSDLFGPREKAFNYEEASRRARRAVREAADRVERMGHGLEAQP